MSTALGFAQAYAEHMDEWKAEPYLDMDEREMDHGAYLVGPDGVRLFVRIDRYNKRSRVQIGVNHDLPPGTSLSEIPHPSISVSRDRDPSAAARDIMRRLVPAAVGATAEVRGRVAAEQARKAELADVSVALVAEFPELRAYGHSRSGERREYSWSPTGDGYGKITISYGGSSASADLSALSIPRLRRVLRALADPDEEAPQ